MCNKLILILLTGALLCLSAAVHAQLLTDNRLKGVWETKGKKGNFKVTYGNAFVFVNDSTGYLTTTGGIYIGDNNYRVNYGQNPLWFDYELRTQDAAHVIIRKALVRFVNDSTLLMKFADGEKRPNVKMTGSHVHTYYRIKSADADNYMHHATIKDLVGSWSVTLDNGKKPVNSVLKPDGTAIYSLYENPLVYCHYQVDFNHRPKIIDFINDADKHVMPGYFTFLTDTTLLIETFKEGKRPSHFRFFGRNMSLIKQH